nr:hypothetical protein [Thermoflavimicrobium daqui]
MDTPSQHTTFIDFLQQRGFKIVRQPPVMLRNSSSLPSRDHLFALAAQAYS